MKNIITKCAAITLLLAINMQNGFSQNTPSPSNGPGWKMGGNNNTGGTGSTVFGTFFPLVQPIFIYTGGKYTCQFSASNALGGGAGDGLRIIGGWGNLLDMWANSANTETHIQFYTNGMVEGANSQLRVTGNFVGLNLNASVNRIFFSRGAGFTEVGRFGNNNFFRIGANPSNVDAARRVEIVDPANSPQFQITQSLTTYTTFQTTSAGDMLIFPTNTTLPPTAGKVGIKTSSPINTLEITSNSTAIAPLTSLAPTRSGLRFSNLKSTYIVDDANNTAPSHTTATVLSVNETGDVILVRDGGTANNGVSLSTVPGNAGTVVLGQDVNQANDPGRLISDREIPMNNQDLIFTYGTNPVKNRIGIGTPSIASLSPQIKFEVVGSVSVRDGSGNTSLFFGREQSSLVPPATNFGEWGIQYWAGSGPFGNGTGTGGLNFWKPFGSDGGFGNRFLFLADNGNVGIGANATTTPATALEITSYPGNPEPAGLRFTNLTSAFVPSVTATKFLTVDGDGDIILANGGGGIGTCNTTATTFAAGDNGIINLGASNSNFYFEGQGLWNTNSVGIGMGCASLLSAKLDVRVTTPMDPLAGSLGGRFRVAYTVPGGTTGNAIGVFGESNVYGVENNFGGKFQVRGSASTANIGVEGISYGPAIENIGVNGYASDNPNNLTNIYGGKFEVPTGNTNTLVANYAVYGIAPSNTLYPNHWAGFFNGAVFAVSYSSDSMLKENIIPIANGLQLARKIKPESFSYKVNDFPSLNFPYGTQFGFTAQQIDTVLPELVQTVFFPEQFDTLGNSISPSVTFKALNYDGFIPVAIGAIKQLDSAISAPPSAPLLISPADGAVNDFRIAIFTWHSVSPGIVLYHAQIATDNSFSNIVIDQRGITDTTFSAGFCDTISTTYYWRVNAKNNAGTGEWSAVFSFTDTAKCRVPFPAPADTIISPKTAVAFNSTSDSRLKTNIAPVTSALDKVNALSGIYYNWVQTPGYEFDSTQQIGLIAQDVQQVVPQVVHTDSNGYLTLDYGRMVPVLVEAIKEQQQTIQSLQSAVGSLQSIVSECCSTNVKTTNTTIPSTELELASANAMLWQNFPNPFGDGTVIRYFVPEKTASANMVFYDEFGNEIKSAELPYKGIKTELNLSTSNLASGIYSYSLIVNGRIADTKQMLKTK